MARITVGPVVGLVTDKTARILIETDSDSQLTVDVTAKGPGGGQDERKVTRQVTTKAHRPTAFDIDGLELGATYTIGFDVDNRDERKARVKPIATDQLRTALVSCNDMGPQIAAKAWNDIGTKAVAGQIDVILHAGNQVYGDEVCRAWVTKLGSMDAATWPAAMDELREDYRKLYRATWNQPFLQKCLANTANLMIWDDHEVADGWGDKPEFADPARPEHMVARAAWEVYREYQRQLWDPEALERGAPQANGSTELMRQRWGKIGLLTLDVRGGRGLRQFDREAVEPAPGDLPYLSRAQWNVIEQALAENGDFAATRTLLVVTPTPVVFIGHRQIKDHLMRAPWGISEKIPDLLDEIRGSWSHGQYRHEQTRLLDRLYEWKKRSPDRELILLSGSMRVGGEWDILDGNTKDVLFRQIVASPVHRELENWMKFRFVSGHLQHQSMERVRVTEPPHFHWRAKEVHRQQNVAYVSVDLSRPAGKAIDSRIALFA